MSEERTAADGQAHQLKTEKWGGMRSGPNGMVVKSPDVYIDEKREGVKPYVSPWGPSQKSKNNRRRR